MPEYDFLFLLFLKWKRQITIHNSDIMKKKKKKMEITEKRRKLKSRITNNNRRYTHSKAAEKSRSKIHENEKKN